MKKKLPKFTGWPELWSSGSLHNFAIIYGEQSGMIEMGQAVDFNPILNYQFNWITTGNRESLASFGWTRIAILRELTKDPTK